MRSFKQFGSFHGGAGIHCRATGGKPVPERGSHDFSPFIMVGNDVVVPDAFFFVLALQEFRKVPEMYPSGNKVPDALLKIGFAYAALGDKPTATKTMRQLVDAYPQSEAAKSARIRLKELKKGS